MMSSDKLVFCLPELVVPGLGNEKGWLESDYFYPVRLGILKKRAGRLFDSMVTRKVRKRKS
jgi:hypothetical protein